MTSARGQGGGERQQRHARHAEREEREVEGVEEVKEVEEVEEVEVEVEVESSRERLARWDAAAAFAGEHTADVARGAAVPLARYCASGEVFAALSSRTQANNAARRGELRINGREAHGASRVRAGDLLSLHMPPPPPVSPPSLRRLERFVDTLTRATVRPESGGVAEQGSGRLQVLHEDAEVAVVFKPPGVHSAPWAGTRKRWGTLTLADALPLLLSPPPAGRAAAAPLAAPLPAHRLDARVGGLMPSNRSPSPSPSPSPEPSPEP